MPRIRSIKPELPEDEVLGSVSREARLLFILLWTRCDDFGCCRAAPAFLRGQLFPYDDDVTLPMIGGWLAALIDAGRVVVYEVDGQQYLEVVNWSKHQRIDNAGKHLVPPNPASLGEPPQDSASLGGSPLDLDLDPDPDWTPTDDRANAAACGDPQFWSEVWETYATRVTRNTKGLRSPAAFKLKVRREGPKERMEEATGLLGQYELTAQQLGAVLAGDAGVLKTVPRRLAAQSTGEASA